MPALLSRVRTAWDRTRIFPTRRERAKVTAHWVVVEGAEAALDFVARRRGVRTSGPDFGPPPRDDQFGYVPTGRLMLRRMFRNIRLGEADVVLEYGAGLGRATLWLAQRYPVSRCIGVEIDADLVAGAKANLERIEGRLRCRDVEFVTADARSFEVPPEVTAIYMFNPFVGVVFERALDNVLASLRDRPRRLQLVYFYPLMHEALIARGFRLVELHRHLFFAWASYEWTP